MLFFLIFWYKNIKNAKNKGNGTRKLVTQLDFAYVYRATSTRKSNENT